MIASTVFTPALRRGALQLRIATTLALLLCGSAARGQPPGAPGDSAGGGSDAGFPREQPFVRRAFAALEGEGPVSRAIAYGPHRDGQRPGGPAPTKAQLRQDLRLMAKRWDMIRIYGAVGPAETILEVIREDRLDLKVMLGVWIAPEASRDDSGRVVEQLPAARAANRVEIDAAVRLAAAYPEIVLAVSVGNETQVSWSAHRVPPELLIGYLREMRARTRVPITTADDFAFWKTPGSHAVARETDFIVTHLHPLWNGQLLDQALDWTQRTFAEVQAAQPGRPIVLGETGWATGKHDEGEQATLIKGRVGEDEQTVFYDAFTAWARKQRVVAFFFEAFDENWKGGPNPNDVEKHWGLFRADRSPKKAMAGGR